MFWTRLAAGRYADASGSIATAHVYAAEGQIDAFRTMAKMYQMWVDLQVLQMHRPAAMSSAVQFAPSSSVVSQISFALPRRKNKPFTAKVTCTVTSEISCLCLLVIGSPSIGNQRLPQVHLVRSCVIATARNGQLLVCNDRRCCANVEWFSMTCVICPPS